MSDAAPAAVSADERALQMESLKKQVGGCLDELTQHPKIYKTSAILQLSTLQTQHSELQTKLDKVTQGILMMAQRLTLYVLMQYFPPTDCETHKTLSANLSKEKAALQKDNVNLDKELKKVNGKGENKCVGKWKYTAA